MGRTRGVGRDQESIERLAAGDEAAWGEFLESYAQLIFQVVRRFESDEDRVADCFLFVCEGLHDRGYRRLRRYRPRGPASFPTWLRAVVRNLCLDWRRARLGRFVAPGSVAELPPLEREAFQLIYRQAMTLDETLGSLRMLFPELSACELLDALERVERRYGAPQLHRRRKRRPVVVSLHRGGTPSESLGERPVPDARPGPEERAQELELARRVHRALDELSPGERLLIRLRFEEELTLREIAGLTGLAGPQAADRRIRKVLGRLEAALAEAAERRGSSSV